VPRRSPWLPGSGPWSVASCWSSPFSKRPGSSRPPPSGRLVSSLLHLDIGRAPPFRCDGHHSSRGLDRIVMRRYRAGTRGGGRSGALTGAAPPYPLATCPLYGICGGARSLGGLWFSSCWSAAQ
jgi:hypothetical protein